YFQLMLDLVAIQPQCIELAQGSTDVYRLIISGGFTQNHVFIKLLASRFPNKKICTTSLPHGAALGAALVVDEYTKSNGTLKKLLNLKHEAPLKELDIERYRWEGD